jgi:hypothetical protein
VLAEQSVEHSYAAQFGCYIKHDVPFMSHVRSKLWSMSLPADSMCRNSQLWHSAGGSVGHGQRYYKNAQLSLICRNSQLWHRAGGSVGHGLRYYKTAQLSLINFDQGSDQRRCIHKPPACAQAHMTVSAIGRRMSCICCTCAQQQRRRTSAQGLQTETIQVKTAPCLG